MGKTIKLTEAELNRLIASKLQEELEHNVDLEYSPAIGNKKRGPGKKSMDQMAKRRNRSLDESFDEKSIYRRLPDGDLDYEGETGGNEGTYTLEISDDAYALAFQQVYGRVPGNLDATLEDSAMPESVTIKFTLSDPDVDGNREIENWDIDESCLRDTWPEMADVVRMAAEYEMENISGDELSGYVNESRKVRMSESQLHSFITESVKKVISEMYADIDFSKCGTQEDLLRTRLYHALSTARVAYNKLVDCFFENPKNCWDICQKTIYNLKSELPNKPTDDWWELIRELMSFARFCSGGQRSDVTFEPLSDEQSKNAAKESLQKIRLKIDELQKSLDANFGR